MATTNAAKSRKLPLPDYISKVIESLVKDEKSFTAEQSREVTEQKAALLNLKLVMESRLKSESATSASEQSTLAFNTSLDDDESLLQLMYEVDKDDSGSISIGELFESPMLKRDENREIRGALQAAFGCDMTAMDKALANFSAEDFGVYCKWEWKDSERAAEVGCSGESKRGHAFDRKASVRAVFDATRKESEATTSPEPSVQAGNRTVDKKYCDPENKGELEGVRVSKTNLTALAEKEKGNEKLAFALNDLARPLLAADLDLDFLAVKRAALRVPRVTGQRLDWARGIGLDAALARQLQPGTLEDGLAGVRGMPFEEAKLAVNAFLEDARVKIYTALVAAKTAKGSRSAAEANSKFEGFQGNFASLEDFHAGAEKSLNLGYPNPDTMKGILLEHTAHPSVERLFKTPNYNIVTNLAIEYAFAMYERRPSNLLVNKALDRAFKIVRGLAKAREGAYSETPDDQLLFPGEVGDSFSESLVMLSFPGVSADSANTFGVKAKIESVKFLGTKEEEVRGITILNNNACVDRIRTDVSVRQQTSNPDQHSQRIAESDDGIQRVGVLLPMSLPHAKKILEQLCAAIAAAVRCEDVTAKIAGRKWNFCRFTGVKELRRWLEDKSLADLRKVLAEEKHVKEWAYLIPGSEFELSHASLCEKMVASFVRTEMRADFCSALESGACDEQIDVLLTGWGLTPHGEREDRIKQAADALDSEKKWDEVEAWVRLYNGRIQGRTLLGLTTLMERDKEKMKLFRLTDSEVLGLYLYTGPSIRFCVFHDLTWFQCSFVFDIRSGVCANERYLQKLPAEHP
jgi:hypothetical protein